MEENLSKLKNWPLSLQGFFSSTSNLSFMLRLTWKYLSFYRYNNNILSFTALEDCQSCFWKKLINFSSSSLFHMKPVTCELNEFFNGDANDEIQVGDICLTPGIACNQTCSWAKGKNSRILRWVSLKFHGFLTVVHRQTDRSEFLKFWSTSPATVPAGNDHYFLTDCPSIRPSVLKLQNRRPGLWDGRVDHWWLLSCWIFFCKTFAEPGKLRDENLNEAWKIKGTFHSLLKKLWQMLHRWT